MTGLPKFVREKLARTPAPSSHPDANVLSAFAENTLTVRERQQVVEHLSICAKCREIVFLAQPEAVDTQTILTTKPRRLTWMAWAAVAAVVVVVASAVILQREQVTKTQPPVTIATTTTPQRPEAKPAGPATTSAANMAVSDVKTRAETPRREAELGARKTKALAEPILTAKDISADEARADLKPPAPSVVLPPPADQGIVVAGAAPRQAPTGPEQRNVAAQLQQMGPANSQNTNIATTNERLARADAVPAAGAAKKQSADNVRNLVTGYSAAPAATSVPPGRAHWQISSTGNLERSFIANNWTPILAETGAKFHVVSVIGNTVWAGGEHGALYVSRDGGATWNSIAIGTTATITSVHISDDLHGTLATADGQAWTTSDGGRTWQKQ